jgi:hypothetical protein
LAGVFKLILFLNPTDYQLTIVAISLNVGLTLITLFLIFHISTHILGSGLLATAPLYLISLSGWAWALCPFPASEPMQALIIMLSIAISLACEKPGTSKESVALSIFALAVISGIGQATKPIVGFLPSFLLLLYLVISHRLLIIRFTLKLWVVVIMGLILMALPTLLMGLWNYLIFGHWIFGSTVGGIFVAQSLDIGMEMPKYFGGSEYSYSENSLKDIREKITLFINNQEYRSDLISQKRILIMSTISGINYVAEFGRMGNDGYSGVGIIFASLAAAYGAVSLYLEPYKVSVERVIAFAFAITIAFLVLTQPLGRYLVPMSMCYPIIISGLVVFCANEYCRGRLGSITLLGAIAIAFSIYFAVTCVYDGWI